MGLLQKLLFGSEDGVESEGSEGNLDTTDEYEETELVPGWLAAVVFVLLLLVFAAAGFVARGWIDGVSDATPYDDEIELLEAAVEETPDDPRSHLSLGFAYQKAGRYDDAVAEYDRVIELNPADTAAIYNKGVVMLDRGRKSEAEELFWDVLEIAPTHPMAAKALGEFYAKEGEYRSLLVAVAPAAEANPSFADLNYLLGFGFEMTGNNVKAIEFYDLAVQYNPDLSLAREALVRLGATSD